MLAAVVNHVAPDDILLAEVAVALEAALAPADVDVVLDHALRVATAVLLDVAPGICKIKVKS